MSTAPSTIRPQAWQVLRYVARSTCSTAGVTGIYASDWNSAIGSNYHTSIDSAGRSHTEERPSVCGSRLAAHQGDQRTARGWGLRPAEGNRVKCEEAERISSRSAGRCEGPFCGVGSRETPDRWRGKRQRIRLRRTWPAGVAAPSPGDASRATSPPVGALRRRAACSSRLGLPKPTCSARTD